MKIFNLFSIAALCLLLLACQNDDSLPIDIQSATPSVKSGNSQESGSQVITSDYLDAINVGLESQGMNYRIAMAEYITNGDSQEAGQTVLAKNVGNKQLGFDFVPNDTRRGWSGADNSITYAIDQTGDAVPFFGGLSAAETDAAIVRATNTWEEVNCSELGQTRNNDFGLDIGLIAFINGLGGSPFVFADVQHAGFRDINFAGGTLGVTFTFGFTDANGFTDINNDGKLDAAFREIYYDPSFSWADDGSSNVDLESVAVHEIGHGLSQGHFGKVAIKNNGTLKASPRAVMNALYAAPYRDLAGTDNGGHCSIWANWPSN